MPFRAGTAHIINAATPAISKQRYQINPARCLRYRFDAETVAALQALQWWHWPDAVVDRFLPRMLDGDVAAFIAAARREGLGASPRAAPGPSPGLAPD